MLVTATRSATVGAAILAGGIRLVRTRPGPTRGTQMAFRTGSNCGESPRCPAVITIDMGFWPCSTAKCSLGSGRRASVRARGRPARRRCRRAAPSAGPHFLAPAACWWARQTVESTLMSQVIRFFESAWACSSVKMRFQVPPLCQRRNRSYTRPQGPYRSGTSRHGAPGRVRHRMPSVSCRRVHIGGRPGFVPLGSSGSSRAHCARANRVRLLMACRTADYRAALTSALAQAFGGAPSPKRLSALTSHTNCYFGWTVAVSRSTGRC